MLLEFFRISEVTRCWFQTDANADGVSDVCEQTVGGHAEAPALTSAHGGGRSMVGAAGLLAGTATLAGAALFARRRRSSP